jgi:hypothetical protein
LLLLHLMRESKYLELCSLVAEYAVLLPSLIWPLRSCGGGKGELPLKWAAVTIAVSFFVVCAPLSRHEYDFRANLSVDESRHSFQARIFRSGRLVLIAEPFPEATADARETPAELDYQNHVLTTRGWLTHFPPEIIHNDKAGKRNRPCCFQLRRYRKFKQTSAQLQQRDFRFFYIEDFGHGGTNRLWGGLQTFVTVVATLLSKKGQPQWRIGAFRAETTTA